MCRENQGCSGHKTTGKGSLAYHVYSCSLCALQERNREHFSYREHLLAVGYEETPLVHCDVVVHIPGHCADGTQCGHIQSYPQIYVHVIG